MKRYSKFSTPRGTLAALTSGFVALTCPALAHAQDGAERAADARGMGEAQNGYGFRPSAMAGLMQWTVFGGGNIAGQVKFGRWVAEYSHGQSLHFENFGGIALTPEEREADLAVGMPWTTGGGFGFQITPDLHVLVEVKAHRYGVEDRFGGNLEYTSFTVGAGVFWDFYVYQDLFVQPNLRWWPTVASTYDGEGRLRAADGSEVRHQRHDLLPFANVNIGWTFSGR